MTLGKRIKACRQAAGISVDELAEKLNKNRATVYRYENDEIQQLPPAALEKLAAVFGVSPAFLMGWENEKTCNSPLCDGIISLSAQNNKKIPLLGEIACGTPIFAQREYETRVTSEETANADFCLTAKGNSMTGARIFNGDTVFIKSCSTVENGQIAAVLIGDEATLKRVYYYPEKQKLLLNPENPDYEPLVFVGEELENVKILGKAVAFLSRLN